MGLKEIARHRTDMLEFNRLQSRDKIGPVPAVDPKGRDLTPEGGKKQAAYSRAQEEKCQHEKMPLNSFLRTARSGET